MGLWRRKPEPGPDDTLLETYAAWYREARRDGTVPDSMPPAREARAGLRIAFGRARELGADFTDPTPDLVTAVLADRDDDLVTVIDGVLGYLLYLRASGLWRRSDRNAALCYDAIDEVADDLEAGRTSYGPVLDEALSAVVAAPAPSAEVQADAASGRRFAAAVGPFLDRVRLGLPGDDAAAAEALGLEATSRVAAHWRRALGELDLIVDVGAGAVAGSRADGWETLDPDARLRVLESVLGGMLEGLALELVEPRADVDAEVLAAAYGVALVSAVAAEQIGGVPLPQVLASAQASSPRLPAEERAEIDRIVTDLLHELVGIGVLVADDDVLRVAPVMLPLVAGAVTSALGWWPEGDREPWWPRVDLASTLTEGESVVLDLFLAGVDTARRRVVLPARAPLSTLHDAIQGAYSWWDSGLHVVRAGEGRHTGRHLLRRFDRDGDERVTASDAVEIGAVLSARGDVAAYSYSPEPGATWQIAVMVAEVLAPDAAQGLPAVDGEGAAPYEYLDGADAWYAFVRALEDEQHPGHAEAVGLRDRHADAEARRRAHLAAPAPERA